MENKFNLIKSQSNYGTNLQTVLECENDVKTNYTNLGHPIAFGGIDTVYNYYKGILDKEKIKEILSSIESYTLHKEYHKSDRNPSYSHFPKYQWQMDLVDIQNLAKYNFGVKYLLTCIDTFSRKAYVRMLTSKQSDYVLQAFESIVREAGGPPMMLCTDQGLEFRNKKFIDFCTKNGIKVITPYSSVHAPYVERFNRSLEQLLNKYLDENETKQFVNVNDKNGNPIPVLSMLLETYNNRKHTATGFSPNEVETNESTHLPIRMEASRQQEKIKVRPVKFAVGDLVRLSLSKSKFSRGYNIQSTNEIFRIYKITKKLRIPMYILENYKGDEIIKGSFYDNELTKVTGNIFRVEKVLKTKKENGKTKHYVKWRDFDNTYNSWIDSDDIVKKF